MSKYNADELTRLIVTPAFGDGFEQYQVDRFSLGETYANAQAKVYRNSEDTWEQGYVHASTL